MRKGAGMGADVSLSLIPLWPLLRLACPLDSDIINHRYMPPGRPGMPPYGAYGPPAGRHGPGVAAPQQPDGRNLTTNDALSYLRDVKQMFSHDKHVYDTFLEIMKDFKAQRYGGASIP